MGSALMALYIVYPMVGGGGGGGGGGNIVADEFP